MDIRARIAEILTDRTIVAYNQYGDDYISDLSAKMLADVLVNELMHPEHQTLDDGMGGVSTNYKTGETTVHSKPCTRQVRWVTAWANLP